MARELGGKFRLKGPLARHMAAAALAVLLVLAAATLRAGLNQHIPALAIFSFFYPAILAAAIFGGEVGAVAALGFSAGVCWVTLHGAAGPPAATSTLISNFAVFLLTGSFVGAVGARLRWLLRRRQRDMLRLADREARYRALFEGASEGIALVEGVWSNEKRLIDFIVTEANPAMLKMLTAPMVGVRRRDYPIPPSPEQLAACERAFREGSVRTELYSRETERWFDVHLSRVSENRLAQICMDITDRKLAETRQTEMFNELNHRVKNNLAAVSAMLTMQARVSGEPQVREQLQKAIERIQTVADVHASLYRASSTEEVDFAAYLRRLCERLSSSLIETDRIWIEVEADPTMAPLEEAVALGLIVNELVTNAVKYAYPPPASGPIRVTLNNRPGELALKVSDDGCGLAQETRSAGIGMRLVRSMVQQCRGELEIKNEAGASFTIHLREHAKAVAEDPQSRFL